MQRLRVTKEELETMIGYLTPLQETPAYREIFAEGEARGQVTGALKQAKDSIATYRTMMAQGLISEAVCRTLIQKQEANITKLQQSIPVDLS